MFAFMSPEEQEAHRQRIQMRMEEHHLRIDSLIANLSTDDAVTLRRLFCAMRGDNQLPDYYMGIMDSVLKYVRLVCPECGINHDDEEMAEAIAKAHEEGI